MGVWLEIVTLLIPGFNDSDDELRKLTGFVARMSPDIPWHVTAFHQDYKMASPADTRAEDLLRAAGHRTQRRIALHLLPATSRATSEGLEDTRCHHCGELLIRARDIGSKKYKSDCRKAIARLYSAHPGPLVKEIRRPDCGFSFSAPQAGAIG